MLIHNGRPQHNSGAFMPLPQKVVETAPPEHPFSRYRHRLIWVTILIWLAFLAPIARNVYLHMNDDARLLESSARFTKTKKMPAMRGEITDRLGSTLAISIPMSRVTLNPAQMKKSPPSPEQLQGLARILGVSLAEINERLNRTNDEGLPLAYVRLKPLITQQDQDAIRALKIKGLGFDEERTRSYPTGKLFSHVVGFVNSENVGQEGVEGAREHLLRGSDGSQAFITDRQGNPIAYATPEANRLPVDGQNLVLSLDRRIQVLAQDELNKAVAYHKAAAGSVVVLDAKTGEILALVNNPAYDPNQLKNSTPEARRNRAVVDMIEPGSTMKPFPIAKALDDRKISPNQWFSTEPYGRVRDTSNHGSLDVRGILQKSSNVGVSKISALYSPVQMHQFYSDIGIGRALYSGFPGETKGSLRPANTWSPFEQATMSFGYGLQMSLLQLARAYTIFTNDGELLPVSFVRQDAPPKAERVISARTAKMMRQLLVSVSEKEGTAPAAAIEGYQVAGKTGTVRKLVDNKKAFVNGKKVKGQPAKVYANNEHRAIFVGFAPAENPRVIVAVDIDRPTKNGYYAGVAAAPVFQSVMRGTLNILGVEPTVAKKR